MVKGQISTLNHLLLFYDGSPKGKEALFLSAYLSKRYKRKLSILVIESDQKKGEALITEARDCLGDVWVEILLKDVSGDLAGTITNIGAEINADLILTGGYNLSPIFEILFGSIVDEVLQRTTLPVIICQ